MKKLLIIVLVITLPAITYFQFMEYRRFHPPVDYDYAVSSEVDASYHDYNLVEDYYRLAVEIGSFARIQWRNNNFDVRFPDESVQSEQNASVRYNQMLSRIQEIEAKLIQSAIYKQEGFSNEEVKLIESGVSKRLIDYINTDAGSIELELGDEGQQVFLLQRELISRGYEHNLDGVFGVDTRSAISSYQTDNGLYPSGSLDVVTFKHLFSK